MPHGNGAFKFGSAEFLVIHRYAFAHVVLYYVFQSAKNFSSLSFNYFGCGAFFSGLGIVLLPFNLTIDKAVALSIEKLIHVKLLSDA